MFLPYFGSYRPRFGPYRPRFGPHRAPIEPPVAEAAALTREHPDKLATLLSVNDLNKLVSQQPHGVLSSLGSMGALNHRKIIGKL